MNSESSIQPDLSDESLLIEYLDGELTQDDRQQVEDRLAKEPELRETLAKLEESWRCLDLLETFATDNDHVETTLETVILRTEQAISLQTEAVRRRFSWMLAAKPLVLLLLFGAGVLLGGRSAPDKNFFLRVASPIIERYDMYTLMCEGDPELLPLLAQRRVFLPPQPDGRGPIDLNEYRPSSSERMLFPSIREVRRRIDRINNLDDALFRQVYRNNEQFNELSLEKKHRLREFHERIELSPQRDELLKTLQGYYNWRKSLQSYEKREIDQPRLSTEQRAELIASLKQRLEANQIVPEPVFLNEDEHDHPPLEELAGILEQLDWEHQEYVLDLPPEQAILYLTQLHRQR